ncbi:Uncharacterized protein T4E_627 [Trichinella pseudospiralis]|uniref:Uncharacterized protein n=1 Tax=Trichinella pseudospiralis TaxID=6337 RepID=A0A0V0XH30_TRIPS|nr:Uncharacterized protein T4E_627 [Trichinella pseudospiralis]
MMQSFLAIALRECLKSEADCLHQEVHHVLHVHHLLLGHHLHQIVIGVNVHPNDITREVGTVVNIVKNLPDVVVVRQAEIVGTSTEVLAGKMKKSTTIDVLNLKVVIQNHLVVMAETDHQTQKDIRLLLQDKRSHKNCRRGSYGEEAEIVKGVVVEPETKKKKKKHRRPKHSDSDENDVEWIEVTKESLMNKKENKSKSSDEEDVVGPLPSTSDAGVMDEIYFLVKVLQWLLMLPKENVFQEETSANGSYSFAAEEKRMLSMFSKEERSKKENIILSQFRELIAKKMERS